MLDEYPEPGEGTPRVKEEAEAVRYSHVVEDIRQVDGFSPFMLPPLFSDLQDAARDSPIIVLIRRKLSCDAIITAHQHSPVCVRLGTNFEKLELLVLALQRIVRSKASPGKNQAKLV